MDKGYRTVSRASSLLARVDSPDWKLIANTEDPDLYRRTHTRDVIKVSADVCRQVSSSSTDVGYVPHADCPVKRVVADMLVNGKQETHIFEVIISNTKKTVKFGHWCLRGSDPKAFVYTFPYTIDKAINRQLEEKGLPIRIEGLNLIAVKPISTRT